MTKFAKREATNENATFTITPSEPIDIMTLVEKPASKPAKKARKASAKKVIVSVADALASYEEQPAASYEAIEEAPSMDAQIEDLQDEIAAFLALEKEQEAAAMHAENPEQAPSEEEIEAMAIALEPSESAPSAGIFWLVKDEDEKEEDRAIAAQASEKTTGKLAAIEEPAAPQQPAKKQASKPASDPYGNEAIVKPGQVLYEGPCELPEGFKVPEDRAILTSKEKSGRMRYYLCGRRADRPGAWIKYGEPNSWWYACSFIDLQKWIEEKAGIEPPCQKQPNIPAVKLGLIPEPAPKPEKQAKKVMLPAGDKGLKMADQRAMQAELNLLRHVNEINSFISFGILPELSLEDGQAFKVMQAFLDGSAIWLFGFNDGELTSKDPYYAIEASDAHLDALCELFQIKRAK